MRSMAGRKFVSMSRLLGISLFDERRSLTWSPSVGAAAAALFFAALGGDCLSLSLPFPSFCIRVHAGGKQRGDDKNINGRDGE